MEKKNEKFLTTLVSKSGAPIYYAPAASTSGNGVKIYRYAFEKVCTDYKRQIDQSESPTKQAILRYQWAKFIMEHVGHYSGNRRFMKELARCLIKEAITTLRREFRRINMNIETAKSCHRITDLWLYERQLAEMNALCPKSLLDQIYDSDRRWVA